MKKYWLSWYGTQSFTLEWPWWISGYRGYNEPTICAAIQANSEDEVREIVLKAQDDPSKEIEWRFLKEQENDWHPFGDRFPKPNWNHLWN